MTSVQSRQSDSATREPIINDFSIVVATVNGSGSQTANTLLIRSMFKMGIPVNGKNLFPSNISGLPTWYSIRVSKQGYIARRERAEIVVAFNPQTAVEDLANLAEGGVYIYPEDLKIEQTRSDVLYYPVPVKAVLKQLEIDPKLRDYVATMVYVGTLVYLLGIPMEEVRAALSYHFNGKTKPIELNCRAVETTIAWAKENNIQQNCGYRVERMNKTDGMLLIDGNTAGALGAIWGGVTLEAWYPITPATGLADALIEYLPKLRTDPETGKATYAVVQAEDELAAIGVAIGAGWAGARAMTSTSGPGISLMAEFAGAAYFAEIPVVIWNVQRVGPSTGLPTRTSQGDVLSSYFLSHGDTRHVCLLPSSMQECFEFGWKAFDLAEELQTPVFVLSDLDLGMNLWMTKPFDYPDQPIKRGKVLTQEDLERLNGDWGRYRDVDGDGVGYRTLPGTNHPRAAFFTRGTGHTETATYSERPADWKKNMDRLTRKHNTARTKVPKPEVSPVEGGSTIGVIAYGSSDPAILEARDRLAAQGIQFDYLRLRALPFETTTEQFLAQHDRVYVIESNHDGQVSMLLRMEYPELAAKVVPLPHNDGMPLSARLVTEMIAAREQGR